MPFGGLLTAISIGSSLGGSIFSGINGANAADNAAQTQADAEKQIISLAQQTTPQANALISSGTTNANDLLSQFYKNNLATLSPYLKAGSTAEEQLSAGTQPGGQFNSQPTAQQILAGDPGYNFRLQQGDLALDRSAASRGTALTGGQLKALAGYNQDYATGDYQNAFNNYNTTQTNLFNRLQTLAGSGLSAAGTATGQGTAIAGQQAGNITSGAGQQSQNLLAALGVEGNAISGAANATASGYVGSANAENNAVNNATSAISQQAMLQKILGSKPNTPSTFDPAASASNGAQILTPGVGVPSDYYYLNGQPTA